MSLLNCFKWKSQVSPKDTALYTLLNIAVWQVYQEYSMEIVFLYSLRQIGHWVLFGYLRAKSTSHDLQKTRCLHVCIITVFLYSKHITHSMSSGNLSFGLSVALDSSLHSSGLCKWSPLEGEWLAVCFLEAFWLAYRDFYLDLFWFLRVTSATY